MCFFFFFKQKTAYEMRISDWSSDVCSSDLLADREGGAVSGVLRGRRLLAVPGLQHEQSDDRGHCIERGVICLAHMVDHGCGCGSTIGRASCRERVCQYV